jgi:O-antigen/teichoic acid export membrane protein
VAGTITMLVVVTAVARSRSLSEFGLYGLLLSLTTYLGIMQTSVIGAALKAFGEAIDKDRRDQAFSIALLLYVVAGIIAGVVLAGAGNALIGILGVPRSLRGEARAALVGLGIVIALGWPLQTFQDLLRGTQRFVYAAAAEVAAYVLVCAVTLVLLATHAALWALVIVGAALPSLMGAGGFILFRVLRLDYHFRPSLVDWRTARGFVGLSGYLFVLGIVNLVVYSLDRAILAAFRSTAAVGLYEGPGRAFGLLRQVQGALGSTVLPTAARYLHEGDDGRVRDLLLRGTRYVVAGTIPVTVVLMVLAKPVLVVWLGRRFAVAAPAMVILTSCFLVISSGAVAVPMLVAGGWARAVMWQAVGVAVANLTLSVILTSAYGLDGVVLGTLIPTVLLGPIIVVMACRRFQVRIADFGRDVWLPAFSLAVPMATVLAALRITVSLYSLPAVVGTALIALALYWAAYYVLWLRPGERLLARDLFRAALNWSSRSGRVR